MPPKIDKPEDCPKFANSRSIFIEFFKSPQTSADILTLNTACQDRICPIRSQCMSLIHNSKEAEKEE